MQDQLFYVGQKAFIEKSGAVLVMYDKSGRLDFPGGKIQESEDDLVESLKREVFEETGLEIEVGEPFYVWHFTLPPEHKNAGKKVFLVGFRCRYVGGELKESASHRDYEWVTRETYGKLNFGNYIHFKALEKYFEAR